MGIKEFRDYLYVCSEDQVRKYNRLNGEFIKTHSQTDGLLSSFLLFHINWNQNLGEKAFSFSRINLSNLFVAQHNLLLCLYHEAQRRSACAQEGRRGRAIRRGYVLGM